MNFRHLCLLLVIASLSACDIGAGSKPVSVTIIPAGVVEEVAGVRQLRMTECFREPLALQVTFSDGSIGNVTSRATWSVEPSGATKLVVSNGDVNVQTIVDGEFDVLESTNFGRGVLIPVQATAAPVTITANFLGLTATLPVIIDALTAVTPVLVPRPVVSVVPPSPKFIGEGFAERFTVRMIKNGRLLDAGDFGRNDSIFNSFLNPVRWTFSGNTAADFIPADLEDDETSNNLAVFVPPGTTASDGADVDTNNNNERRAVAIATLTPNGGLVAGVKADPAPLTIQAQLSPVDGTTTPCGTALTTTAGIAALIAGNELSLSHEADFRGTGLPANGDLVAGTNELLKTTANLDTDVDGAVTVDATQDVTTQVDYEVIEADRDVCTQNSITGVTTCASSILLFGPPANYLATFTGTDGSFNTATVPNPRVSAVVDPRFDGDADIDVVKVRACYPLCTNNSDSDEPDFASTPLAMRAVPARLDSVAIAPTPQTQMAFTVPGVQYKAYGTYTAGSIVSGSFVAAPTADTQFAGGGNATQNIGRYLSWIARPAALAPAISDDFSEIAQLTNSGSLGNLEAAGQVFYICNPLATTPVADRTLDIFASTNNTTVISTTISDLIDRATLIVDRDPLVLDRACE